MLNGALISRNVARLLRLGPRDLASFAIERHELCPVEDVTRPPALYPKGAVERILGLSPWRDWQTEQALVQGGHVRHEPTEALVIPNVALAGAFLYRGGAKERIGRGQAKMLDRDLPPVVNLPEAHLVSTWTGADFFGNFIQDTLPLEMIPVVNEPRIAAPTKPYLHEVGYRDLLELPASQGPAHARIGRLTVYRDFSQNSYKVARYNELRDRLRKRIGKVTPPAGIFLRRGSAHGEPRRLVNEDAVIEMLAAMDFDILDPEEMMPDTIARLSLDAPIVVSVEGSHLAHALFSLAAGGSFLVIQPPDRFAMPYKEVADSLGMAFGFVVGAPAGEGFTADLDEIRQMLERLT